MKAALLTMSCALLLTSIAHADVCARVMSDNGTLVYDMNGAEGSIYGASDGADRLLHGCYLWAVKDQNTQTPTLCFNAKYDESDIVVESMSHVQQTCPGL